MSFHLWTWAGPEVKFIINRPHLRKILLYSKQYSPLVDSEILEGGGGQEKHIICRSIR